MEKRAKAIAVLILLLATSFSVLVPAVSTAASPAEYVTITLTNSQTTATQKNFSQMIKVDWSTYATDLNANVSNVRFYNSTTFSSSTELSGWIEDNNTTTATSSNVWVNLSGTIVPASGSATIYMAFLSTTASWSSHWGLAPQLSTKYGEFDNGANVFSLYFNGNTATSDFTVSSTSSISQVQVTGPTGTTINALKYSEDQCSAIGLVYSLKSLQSGDYIGETSFSSGGGGDIGVVGLGTSSSATTSQYMFSADTQFGGEYLSWAWNDDGTNNGGAIGGTSTTAWHYEWFSYTPGTSTASICAAPQLYSTSDGYSGTVNNYIPSSDPVYVSAASNGNSYLYYNWLRIRDTPPDGIMPSVSFGSVSTVTTIGYHISFQQTSLPSGTKWGIRLNNTTSVIWQNSNGEYDNLTGLLAGTYTYQVVNATGYASNPYTGLLKIVSSNLTQSLTFTGYTLTATESGLPTGDTWYLNLSDQPGLSESAAGQHLSGTTSSLTTSLPNGTYSFTYQTQDKKYSGGSGSFIVNGATFYLNVAVSPVLYYLNFTPLDKPSSLLWGVNLSGTIKTGTGNLSFEVTNGTYFCNASAINGSFNNPLGWWRLTSESGTVLLHNESSFPGMKVEMNGRNYQNNITFARAYNITFEEVGIGNTFQWDVNLSNGLGNTLDKHIIVANDTTQVFFNSTEGNYTNSSYAGSIQVLVYGSTGTRYINFTSSSISETVDGKNLVVVYNFITQYFLTMKSIPASGGYYFPFSGWNNESSTVQLTAYANSSYEFTGFQGSNTSSYTGMGYYSSGGYVASITMTNPISEDVDFSNYIVLTFYMQNLSTGQEWGIKLSGPSGLVQWDNSTGYFIVFDIPQGTYTYLVTGILSTPQTNQISVAASREILLRYITKTCDVNFEEIGLQPGTSWSMKVFTSTFSSSISGTSSILNFEIPSGTYSYFATSVYGYISNDSSGSFTISGSPILIYVNWAQGNPFILQGIRYFASITLNTSDHVIPAGTQIPININWAKYQKYENANLSNVIFMNSTFYPLYAWIENNASSSFTSSTVWIKINQKLPYDSSTTIYLAFESKDRFNLNKYGYLGEASQYSNIFGEYNNIGMVMNKGLAIQFFTNQSSYKSGAITPTTAIEQSLYSASMGGGSVIPSSVAGLNYTSLTSPLYSNDQGTVQNVPNSEQGSGAFTLAKEEDVILNYYLSDTYAPGSFPSPPFDYDSGNVFYGKAQGFVDLTSETTDFYAYIDDGSLLGLTNNGSYTDWLGNVNNQANVFNEWKESAGTPLSSSSNMQGTFRISMLYAQATYGYAFWNLWTNYNVKYYSPTFVNGLSSLIGNISIGPIASSYNSFYEYGLPVNTNWSIAISGPGFTRLYTTNSNLIYTYLPNGTYLYTVGSMVNGAYHSGIDGKFIPSPESGHLIVTGTFTVQVITFSLNEVLKYNLDPEQASGVADNVTLPILAVNIQGLPAGNTTISSIINHLTAKLIAKDQDENQNLTWSLSSSKYGMIVIFLHLSNVQIQAIRSGTAVVSFVAAFQLGTVSQIAAGVAGPQVFSQINESTPKQTGLNFSSPQSFLNSLNNPLSKIFGQGPLVTHLAEVVTIIIAALAAYYLERIRRLHDEADKHVKAIKKSGRKRK